MSMETKQDYSYGVVPVHKNEAGEWEVFILNQISVRSDIYWTFPKGHPDEGETKEETALRELREESGLVAVLNTEYTISQSYNFKHNEFLVEKTVEYFVGEVTNKNFIIQPEEVAEAKWCSFEEAYNLLTHDLSKETLEKARNYLLNK